MSSPTVARISIGKPNKLNPNPIYFLLVNLSRPTSFAGNVWRFGDDVAHTDFLTGKLQDVNHIAKTLLALGLLLLGAIPQFPGSCFSFCK